MQSYTRELRVAGRTVLRDAFRWRLPRASNPHNVVYLKRLCCRL